MEEIIKKAVETMREGGVILYPTDTIWGIGCDASNADAIEKIYQVKQRDHSKSMLILCGDEVQTMLPETYLSCRPTTFIIEAGRLPFPLADNLLATDGTIGVRMPQHRFCQQLITALGHPIVSTSANFSGTPSPTRYDDIDEQLKTLMDYCVPPLKIFESGETQSSRIIKITPEGVIIIRD